MERKFLIDFNERYSEFVLRNEELSLASCKRINKAEMSAFFDLFRDGRKNPCRIERASETNKHYDADETGCLLNKQVSKDVMNGKGTSVKIKPFEERSGEN